MKIVWHVLAGQILLALLFLACLRVFNLSIGYAFGHWRIVRMNVETFRGGDLKFDNTSFENGTALALDGKTDDTKPLQNKMNSPCIQNLTTGANSPAVTGNGNSITVREK